MEKYLPIVGIIFVIIFVILLLVLVFFNPKEKFTDSEFTLMDNLVKFFNGEKDNITYENYGKVLVDNQNTSLKLIKFKTFQELKTLPIVTKNDILKFI
jgi:hypothetical protein